MSMANKIDHIEREKVEKCLKPQGLIEKRCSCDRLLGRFNGQAEVKCSKCGKLNVIEDT